MKNNLRFMIVLFVLACMSLACGTTDPGRLVTPVPTVAVPTAEPSGGETSTAEDTATIEDVATVTDAATVVYKVGDTIEIRKRTITLNSADFNEGSLILNFTIVNNDTKTISSSSIAQFTARDPDGNNLELTIFDCSPSLDGVIPPGEKLKGNVCYKNVTADTVKVYYLASFAGETVTWEVKRP